MPPRDNEPRPTIFAWFPFATSKARVGAIVVIQTAEHLGEEIVKIIEPRVQKVKMVHRVVHNVVKFLKSVIHHVVNHYQEVKANRYVQVGFP
jgi:hypothetical protein